MTKPNPNGHNPNASTPHTPPTGSGRSNGVGPYIKHHIQPVVWVLGLLVAVFWAFGEPFVEKVIKKVNAAELEAVKGSLAEMQKKVGGEMAVVKKDVQNNRESLVRVETRQEGINRKLDAQDRKLDRILEKLSGG